MVMISTERLPLDHDADSANLDRTMTYILVEYYKTRFDFFVSLLPHFFLCFFFILLFFITSFFLHYLTTRREAAFMHQLFVRLELVMAVQFTKYEKKLIKLFIMAEQNFKIIKLNFKHVSGWLLTYCLFIGVLLDAGRDLFVISHFLCCVMTTNKYQLIRDLLKAFLRATEKTFVPQMTTCTAKGLRKNFLRGADGARRSFSTLRCDFSGSI